MARWISAAGAPLIIRSSAGVAFTSERVESGSALVDRADRALYAAKRRGRDQTVRFDDVRASDVASDEAPVLRIESDDLPAQGARHPFRLCQKRGGGEGREVGDNVGIRLPLGRGHGRACVGQPVGGGRAHGRERDKDGRMRRIRRDIMNRRDTPGLRVVEEGYPGTEHAEQHPHVRVPSASTLAAHPTSHSSEQTHHQSGQARDGRPLHEGEQGEADIPHPEPIAERGQEDTERADERQPTSPSGSES